MTENTDRLVLNRNTVTPLLTYTDPPLLIYGPPALIGASPYLYKSGAFSDLMIEMWRRPLYMLQTVDDFVDEAYMKELYLIMTDNRNIIRINLWPGSDFDVVISRYPTEKGRYYIGMVDQSALRPPTKFIGHFKDASDGSVIFTNYRFNVVFSQPTFLDGLYMFFSIHLPH